MKHARSTTFLPLIFPLLLFTCKDLGVVAPPRPIELRPLTQSELKLVQANSRFWLGLLQEVNKADDAKNVFISPLSISMALGMTLNGARGETFDSMRATLQFSNMSEEEINDSYRSLVALLTNADPNVQLNIANSIWHRNTFAVEREFIDINKTYFDAVVSGLDFTSPSAVNVINSWVNDQTRGKIGQIIDKIRDYMMLYLINAIYFKGTWTSQFNKDKTRDDEFTLRDGSKQPCKMMMQEEEFGFYANEKFTSLDLPYGGRAFSMTIVLPRSGEDIGSFLNSFQTNEWETLITNLRETKILTMIPKFKLEYETGLIPTLSGLGMGIAFSDYADFKRINKDVALCISEAKHKTYVNVDEEGTEAAAVTSIGVGVTSAPPMFRVDRPFLFVIRERSSGTILFVGKILNPNR